jgi:hypothetical protein
MTIRTLKMIIFCRIKYHRLLNLIIRIIYLVFLKRQTTINQKLIFHIVVMKIINYKKKIILKTTIALKGSIINLVN